MKPTTPSLATPRRQPVSRAPIAAVSLAVLALVAACGGGGGSTASSPSATTPGTVTASASYSQGAIAGFGSVIVNGVRWDDSTATITDDDGNRRSASDLKLGMSVEVEGGSVDRAAATASGTTPTGKASKISFGAELQGPVAALDATAGTFTLLGRTVLVTSSTVFDSTLTGGLAALTAGAVVEVHGLYDATAQQLVATRIEAKPAATAYKLRGTVAALDTTAKTFKLGTETISYANLTEVPSTLANGLAVKVRLQTTQVAGAWVATKLRAAKSSVSDGTSVEVQGLISVFTSATSFEINGLKIDASSASFDYSDTAGIALGSRVEVEGSLVAGVLVATKVSVEDSKPRGGGKDKGVKALELHGTVSALNTTAKTFTLRGLTVSYASSTLVWKDGGEAKLADGVKLEVKGALSSDGTQVVASKIEFE
jgi:hypothetical protein